MQVIIESLFLNIKKLLLELATKPNFTICQVNFNGSTILTMFIKARTDLKLNLDPKKQCKFLTLKTIHNVLGFTACN